MQNSKKHVFSKTFIRIFALILMVSSLTGSFADDFSAGSDRSVKKATFYVR